MQLASVLLLSSICAAMLIKTSVTMQQCEHGAWPPPADDQVRQFVIDLDKPVEDRWTEVVRAYREPLLDLIAYTKTFILDSFHLQPRFFKYFEEIVPARIGIHLPDEYLAEMQGIATQLGVHQSYVIFSNVFYEFFMMCTSVITYDEDSESIVHGRNLDFGAMLGWDMNNHRWFIQEKLRNLMGTFVFKRRNKSDDIVFESAGYAGSVGVMTGMKPGKFAISINARFALDGGPLGVLEWILDTKPEQRSVMFAARDVLQGMTQDYREALSLLLTWPLTAPVYYALSGVGHGEGCIIGRARSRTEFKWHLNSTSTEMAYRVLVQTNYDTWPSNERPPLHDDRASPVYSCLCAASNGSDWRAAVYNALSTRPVLNVMTVHTTLMAAKSSHIESYLRDVPMGS